MPKDGDKPTSNIRLFEGKKTKSCRYCGMAEHEGEFACPRIESITINSHSGDQYDIFFRPDFFEVDIVFEADDDDDDEEDDSPPAA